MVFFHRMAPSISLISQSLPRTAGNSYQVVNRLRGLSFRMLSTTQACKDVNNDHGQRLAEVQHLVATERFDNFSDAFLRAVNHELMTTGKCLLQGFMRMEAVSETVREARRVVAGSYRSENTHNVYLEETSTEFAKNHPRNMEVRSAKRCIAGDEISAASPLRQLYHSDFMLWFAKRATGQDQLYRTGDPLGDLNIHVYNAGDELGWHMDRGEFAVTIHLQEPDGGGVFEYVENVRTASDPGYGAVGAVLRCKTGEERGKLGVKYIPQKPGDLLLFRGHQSMHRVTPVRGDTARMLTVLSFDLVPGKMLNEYTRLKFYGR